MQNIELPLVLFTVLSQAAVGMALFLALRSCACAMATGPATGEDAPGNRTEWLAATAAMGVALLASLFHLGHPEGAVRTLAHLEKAWLSREILAFGAFAALLAVAAVTGKAGAGLRAAAALVGLFALYTSGRLGSSCCRRCCWAHPSAAGSRGTPASPCCAPCCWAAWLRRWRCTSSCRACGRPAGR